MFQEFPRNHLSPAGEVLRTLARCCKHSVERFRADPAFDADDALQDVIFELLSGRVQPSSPEINEFLTLLPELLTVGTSEKLVQRAQELLNSCHKPLMALLAIVARRIVTRRHSPRMRIKHVALPLAVPLADDTRPEDGVLRREDCDRVREAMTKLTEWQQRIVESRVFYGKTTTAFAAASGRCKSSASAAYGRAISKLRSLLYEE